MNYEDLISSSVSPDSGPLGIKTEESFAKLPQPEIAAATHVVAVRNVLSNPEVAALKSAVQKVGSMFDLSRVQ